MQYLNAFILVAMAAVMACGLCFLSRLLAPRRPSKAKNAPYECGFDALDPPQHNARHPLDVKFYRIGLLFLVFDVEIALLLPWAAGFAKAGAIGLWTALSLLLILTAGFLYEWKKGVLAWK